MEARRKIEDQEKDRLREEAYQIEEQRRLDEEQEWAAQEAELIRAFEERKQSELEHHQQQLAHEQMLQEQHNLAAQQQQQREQELRQAQLMAQQGTSFQTVNPSTYVNHLLDVFKIKADFQPRVDPFVPKLDQFAVLICSGPNGDFDISQIIGMDDPDVLNELNSQLGTMTGHNNGYYYDDQGNEYTQEEYEYHCRFLVSYCSNL